MGDSLKRHRGPKGIAEARDAEYKPEDVSERDRAGVDLTVAILNKLKDAVSAQKANFYVVFIPYKPHIVRRRPDNHPLVRLIAAALTRAGINYREPYPEFLKSELAGTRLFNVHDDHFGAPEGPSFFRKISLSHRYCAGFRQLLLAPMN